MARVRRHLARAAEAEVAVLVTGETGTGKTFAARALHLGSRRRPGPFVRVNCAGIPAGLLESELFGHERGAFTGAVEARRGLFQDAHGGTLFLDELGELPPGQQAKLLTALDEGRIRRVGGRRTVPVDARLVSATTRNLAREAAEGRFRPDLYHRVAVVRIHLPPLRERREDVLPLARHFLARIADRHGRGAIRLARDGARFLVEHPWPGNLRELQHLLEAAVVLRGRGELDADALREAAPGGGPPGSPASPGSGRYSFFGTPAEEIRMIRNALVRFRGNRTRAARHLGMARGTLRSKIRRYGLD